MVSKRPAYTLISRASHYILYMKISVKELAALTGGQIDGDAEVYVSSFAKIEEAGPSDLTFLANTKYTHYIYSTQAAAVLVNKDFQPQEPIKATLIRVDDAYATLAHLMTLVKQQQQKPSGIEEPCHIADDAQVADDVYVGAFAYIGKGAKVGKGTLIYPQVYIGDNVEIGEDCIIYPGAKIYFDCKIGNRCIIQAGAVIGGDGFGFAPTATGYDKIPQMGNVVLEDDTEVGANTTIDRATMGSTRIGKGTKLDNLIQVAHNVTIGRNNVFAAQSGFAGSSHVGDCNMIGGQVGVAGHIKIGSHNQIGAQSGIPNNVGDNGRLMGYPAIDARQFAKNLVYVNRLQQLFHDFYSKK